VNAVVLPGGGHLLYSAFAALVSEQEQRAFLHGKPFWLCLPVCKFYSKHSQKAKGIQDRGYILCGIHDETQEITIPHRQISWEIIQLESEHSTNAWLSGSCSRLFLSLVLYLIQPRPLSSCGNHIATVVKHGNDRAMSQGTEQPIDLSVSAPEKIHSTAGTDFVNFVSLLRVR